jgi:hypothetical protein
LLGKAEPMALEPADFDEAGGYSVT